MRFIGQTACVAQQWPDRTPGLFHLPERIAAMLDVIQRIQRADASKRNKLLAV